MPAKKSFILGTAVKITSVISIATATTAKITIDDPNKVVKIDAVDMTKDADYVYSYIYQSVSTDDDGEYVITISINDGNYTAVIQDKFVLEEQE